MTANQWEDHVFELSRLIEPKDLPPKRVPRKFKFDLNPPDAKRGTLLNTLTGRSRNKQHTPTTTMPTDGQQDSEESSPGPGSAPPSPSPFTLEGASINGTHSLENSKRKGSLPGTATPPRPPKPGPVASKSTSYTELPSPHPVLNSAPILSRNTSAPAVPPKPQGKGKPPPPPSPNNDGPPLPPRTRNETPPPACSLPANVIPLPPREHPPPPPLPRRWKESPPPPIPPKGLRVC